MYLYRRENSPYWWVRISKLDDCGRVTGYNRMSTKRTDKGEAKLVAREYEKKLHDRMQLGIREAGTIGEAANRYLNELVAARKPSVKDAQTFIKKARSSNSVVSILKSIKSIDRAALMALKNLRMSEGYSPKYINNEITFWITVYNKARVEYMMDVNIHENFDGLKMKSKEKTRYLLNDLEEKRLLEELDPQREIPGVAPVGKRSADTMRVLQDQYDLVVFLLDTGARYSEVAEIPWSAINTTEWNVLNLYREKVGNEGQITMTNRLREMLQRRFKETNSPYVFASRHDPMVPRGYSTKGIAKAIQRAGLNSPHLVKRYGRFTPHSLRHTFASRLVQAGMSLYGVSRLLGHTNTTMTQRYAHLAPSKVSQQAADILNGGTA